MILVKSKWMLVESKWMLVESKWMLVKWIAWFYDSMGNGWDKRQN